MLALVGTQNIDAITPSAVGPTTEGGPHEGDSAVDQKAMDRARGLSAVARGYGINEGSGRDLLPGL